MKTYRNHHTRNRTRRRRMKGGTYADDLALVTKYVENGSRVPLNPSDMRPSDAELDSIDRIVKGYPVSENLKGRMQASIGNLRKTSEREGGYGQQVTRQLASRFAGEIGELKTVVEANPPAERNANNDFYLPLQSLHRIAYEFSNSLTPANQAKLVSNKTQYDRAKGLTDGKQPVDQDAANVELLGSVTRFVPELGEWFRGLSRLKNVQIAARPAERERLFALLPPRLRASDELAKIFDAYSARIADVYVNLSTSAALGNQAALAKPEKPGRKVVEPPRPEPERQAVPQQAAVLRPPLPSSPPESSLAEPEELPPPLALPEARSLGATPLQESSVPPPRRNPERGFNALGAVPAAAEGMNLAGPVSNSLPLPSYEGPRDMTPRPKVNRVYVAPPEAERTPAPVIPDVSSTTRSGLPARVPGVVPPQPVFQTIVSPTSAPGRSALAATASPGVLQQQLTPLTSDEQRQFLKGAYQSVDTTKSFCERRYPTVYSILESGKFNGSDIISLLNSNDPKVLELFKAIGYDREAKKIMGHPLVEVYLACHPDRGVSHQEQLTRIFQVLKALEAYTGFVAPSAPIENVDPEEQASPAEVNEEEFVDDSDDETDDGNSAIIQAAIKRQFPGSGDQTSLDFLRRMHNWSSQDKLKQTKDWIVATTRRAIEFAASRCNSKDAVIVNRRKKVLLDLLATFNARYTDEQFAQQTQLILKTTIQAVKSANEQSGLTNTGTRFKFENELSREFIKKLVYSMASRNQQELRNRTIEFGKFIYKSFHREPWCFKPDLADVTKQEFLKDKFGAKWINDTKQGLILTSKSYLLSSTLPKTMTISRGDCFSFTPAAFKIFFPTASDPKNKYFIDITSQKNNHFTVSNITELPVGFNLTIFNATSGSIVKDSRLEFKLTNYNQINSIVNGIIKKDCPKGVGLTPQVVLPDDCPKKLLNTQLKLVGEEAKARNFERQATTCETELARLRDELAKVLQNNSEETASLRSDIAKDQAKLQELQASKEEIAGELAGLRQKIEFMERNLNEFEGQLREAGKTKSKLEAERDKLEREIITLTANNVENKALITENLGRIAGLRRQVEAASAQERTLQEQYSKMQSELLAAQSSVADLNSRFATTDGLIRATDEQIRADLAKISKTLGEGVEQITDGIQYLVGLADDTRSDIAKTRTGFTEQFSALQSELARTELARRGEILQAIQSLKVENQESMAALQRDLAAASAEKDRLQAELSREQAAKATAEGQVTAKNEEIARKDQEHVAALEAARQVAANTAEQVKAANDRALQSKDAESAAKAAELEMALRGHLDALRGQLTVAIARSDAAEASVADRAGLEAELVRVREEIARLRVPPPVAAPPPAPAAPVITGREPAGEVTTGTNIAIQWNNNGTPSPWILRVDYDGANPDFQEVTDSAPIKYTIKRPGVLSGRIYSVTVV